jgi:DNA modification methylase
MTCTWEYLVGDVRNVLAGLAEQSVQCIVTSPPYWGLRDYGIPPSVWGGDPECEHEWGNEIPPKQQHADRDHSHNDMLDTRGEQGSKEARGAELPQGAYCQKCGAWRGCLGLEPTPEMFIEHLVEVCRGLWRVLRDDGTFWLNLGDSYATGGGGAKVPGGGKRGFEWRGPALQPNRMKIEGLKPKDLVMMPHRVALALQADGWYVRGDIVWAKPNPMPESTRDRPTRSHEYIFLLTKKSRYFYDREALKVPAKPESLARINQANFDNQTGGPKDYGVTGVNRNRSTRKALENFAKNPTCNIRDVWNITVQPYPDAHFATFPEKIPELCIKAGTSEWGGCPQCGSPWERVVEKVASTMNIRIRDASKEILDKKSGHGGRAKATKKETDNYGEEVMGSSQTLGFKPTCECPDNEPIPCIVLDPFAGSGTTVLVARRLGRSAIAIDINPKYKKLAKERAMLDIPDIMTFKEEDHEQGN